MNRLSFFLPSTVRLLQETAEKSVWKKFATRMSSFFVFSLATLFFLGGVGESKEGKINGIATTSSTATTEVLTIHSDISSFFAQETELTNPEKILRNTHSLKTLTKVKSKQISLSVPSDQAFEKLGDAEKEKLLDSDLISSRLEIKSGLLLPYVEEVWNSKRETYIVKTIKAKTNTREIISQSDYARILKNNDLEGGHFVFTVDNYFANPLNLS